VHRAPPIVLAGTECIWPEGVPRGATFHEVGRDAGHVWGQFSYVSGKARVSWALKEDVFFTPGNICTERYFNRDGVTHGLDLSRHKDGSLEWQLPWVRGRMHGIARQFDEHGRELLRTRFVQGSGVDLWANGTEITELRVHRNNHRHGVERWGHPLLPYEENYFLEGRRAGVFRRWDGLALEKGYPQYFVDDEEVTRAEYVRARRRHPELPRDDRADDERARRLHPSLRRAWLRKDVLANVLRAPGPDEWIGCGSGACRTRSIKEPEPHEGV
jgi:hypothetical protein